MAVWPVAASPPNSGKSQVAPAGRGPHGLIKRIRAARQCIPVPHLRDRPNRSLPPLQYCFRVRPARLTDCGPNGRPTPPAMWRPARWLFSGAIFQPGFAAVPWSRPSQPHDADRRCGCQCGLCVAELTDERIKRPPRFGRQISHLGLGHEAPHVMDAPGRDELNSPRLARIAVVSGVSCRSRRTAFDGASELPAGSRS